MHLCVEAGLGRAVAGAVSAGQQARAKVREERGQGLPPPGLPGGTDPWGYFWRSLWAPHMAGTACDEVWVVPLGPTAKMVLGVAPIPLSPPMLLIACLVSGPQRSGTGGASLRGGR